MLRSWLPLASFCFSAATRTMKNSSRFELTMERNFTRSSSLLLGSLRFFENASLKFEQAELAIHVERRIVQRRRSGAGGGFRRSQDRDGGLVGGALTAAGFESRLAACRWSRLGVVHCGLLCGERIRGGREKNRERGALAEPAFHFD